ncbi:MAG TPA: hypothetical protein VND93_10575 [Myxococcales bacterium]|nr:hypothetical protein [Myxococcales bacterium]
MTRRRRLAPASPGTVALPLALWALCAPGLSGAQQVEVYCTSNVMVYLSGARTMGGVGGGVGVRGFPGPPFILQADVSSLLLLGNVAALRLGAGVQRSGLYSPFALVTALTLLGDRLTFLTPDHPVPVTGPAVSLGVTVAPLRFVFQGAEVSLLQLGAGLGTDLPGLGISYSLGLMEVGAAF